MTVEYFTPSEEDIEQAPHRLLILQAQLEGSPILYNNEEMTILDFSHLYTEEEKAAARQQLLTNTFPSPFGNVEFSSHQPYDTARAKAMARHVLGNSPLRPLDNVSITEVSVTRGNESVKLKDFTPVAVQSVLPDVQVNPNYQVKEVKTINGKKYTFYGQELPKDKS